MVKVCLYISFFALLTTKIEAQTGSGIKASRFCVTMEQDSILRAKFPKRGTLDDFERAIMLKVEQIQRAGKHGRLMEGIIRIPIIVHVVHNGEPVGSETNLSQAQVQAQIDVLNEDFRKKAGTPGGVSTNPVAADIEIEFCLSPVDDKGNNMVEPGIDRHYGGRSVWHVEQIEEELKPATIWNPNLFYNIWTLNLSVHGGYAQFPDQTGLAGIQADSPASTDGVVIQYSFFGSVDKGNFPVMMAPYNKGRALTHETGHWLGLRHIWGDGPCADDYVSDTPPQEGASSGCPIGRVSCSVTNMVENYMDYSSEACMNIFTEGQKTRMHAAIQISPRRKALVQAHLCSPDMANVPTPNFTTDNPQCVWVGSELTFIDLSTNFPKEWYWEFEGGYPATSTDQRPTIRYDSAGIFKVSLTVSNSIGQSDTLIADNYIIVSEYNPCRSYSNYKAEFTSTVLNLSEFNNYTGYLTGHNSTKSKAISEFFSNRCGYYFISGASIRFDNVSSSSENATVSVIVWDALGEHNGPGSVITRKEVLLKQILEDISNSRPTIITFNELTPLSDLGNAFYIGVELKYSQNYSLAIKSSALGEAKEITSWVQDAAGVWKPISTAFGINIAMDIKPMVGNNPSVQVSASKLLVYPGEEVVLTGHGANTFRWNSSDGSIGNHIGPQIIVHPLNTTTYITIGSESGYPLCRDTVSTTIFVRSKVTSVEIDQQISFFPNPGSGFITIQIDNNYTGEVDIRLLSLLGQELIPSINAIKFGRSMSITINTHQLTSGMYVLNINLGGKSVVKRWIKF